MGKYNQSFKGMRQDYSESLNNGEYYFEARNLNIYPSTKSRLGGIGNLKSNKQLVKLDYEYDSLETSTINGGLEIEKDVIIIFSTHTSYFGTSVTNRISKVTGETQEVVFSGDLGISASDKITVLHNPETESVNKIYWCNNAKQQIRSLNLSDDNTGKTQEAFDIISTVNFTTPTITVSGWGGKHTAGSVQYAYSYFNFNGQESKISPLTKLIPLTKSDNQGGDLNQVVGQNNNITFTNLDTSYDYIKVYAIKYNARYEEPIISLINQSIISGSSLSVLDDGSVVSNVSTEQFTFLGGTLFYPQTIEIKDNRLFAANIKEDGWDVDVDVRAYRHNISGDAIVTNSSGQNVTLNPSYDIALDDDVIQTDFDTFKFSDGTQFGAKGKYVTFNLELISAITNYNDLIYKSNEVYRFGLIFFNKYAERSSVKWICDYKMPYGVNAGLIFAPQIVFNSAGITALEDAGVVGYQLVRVERTANDRSVLFQGVAAACMVKTSEYPYGFGGDPSDSRYLSAGHSRSYELREESIKKGQIYPTLISRNFKNVTVASNNYTGLYKYKHLQCINNNAQAVTSKTADDIYGQQAIDAEMNPGYNTYAEVYMSGISSGEAQSSTIQDTKIWQIHSPELTFTDLKDIPSGVKVRVVGFIQKTGRIFDTGVQKYEMDQGLVEEINAANVSADINNYSFWADSFHNYHQNGFVGWMQDDRAYHYCYKKSLGSSHVFYGKFSDTEYDIYGTPLVLETGEASTAYNNNSNYKISNDLTSFGDNDYTLGKSTRIASVNSYGTKSCFIIPINPNADSSLDDSHHLKHLRLEEAFNFAGSMGQFGDPIVELFVPLDSINLYGGNTYEARSLNTYIPISDYRELTDTSIIYNSGDTRYQPVCYERFTEGPLDYTDDRTLHHSEIVDTILETSVDMYKRNDVTAAMEKGSPFSTTFTRDLQRFINIEETIFHNYNTVYSREGNFITYAAKHFLFKENTEFPNLIRASKVKVNGELIDSFTDFLVNEETTVGAKYGEITKLHTFNDSLYVFTPESVTYLSINPRVQTVGDDGISLELGTGTLFGKDKALTTESGVSLIDVNSVVNSPAGIYFFDRNNVTICKVTDRVEGISATKGNFITITNAFTDRNLGVVSGYEPLTNTLYVTIPTESSSDTILFSEAYDEFISWVNMRPTIYFSGRTGLFNMKSDSTLWKELKGSGFNNIHGVNVSSEFETIVTAQHSAVFTSVEWKSVIDGINNKTFNKIQVSHEDQDSGLVNMIAKNKFNKFRANIPRHAGAHFGNRITGRWVKLKLVVDSDSENREMILHELAVNYQDKI